MEKVGFQQVRLLSVEGLGRWLPKEDWEHSELRKQLLYFLEKTEEDPSILGVSAHIMAIGKKNI